MLEAVHIVTEADFLYEGSQLENLELFEMECGVQDPSVFYPFLTVVTRNPKGEHFYKTLVRDELLEVARLV